MIRRRSPEFQDPNRQRGRHSTFLSYDAPRGRTGVWILLVMVVVGLGVSLVFPYGPRISLPSIGGDAKNPRPLQVSQLSATGVLSGSSFAIGNPISLSWKASGSAHTYRLQIVSAGGPLPAAQVLQSFRHPWVTAVTGRALYIVRINRVGTYYWRVQALMGKSWRPFTAPTRFDAVAALARPILVSPLSGARLAEEARFCWSPIAGATSYLLTVNTRIHHVRATCVPLTLSPGPYTWSVAAMTGTVIGPASPTSSVIVPVPALAVRPIISSPVNPTRGVKPTHIRAPVRPAAPASPSLSTGPYVVPTLPPANPSVVYRPAPVVQPAPPAVQRPVIQPASPPVIQPASPPVVARPISPSAPAAKPTAAPKQDCIPMYTC